MDVEEIKVGDCKPESPGENCKENNTGYEIAGHRISYSLDWGFRGLSILDKAHDLVDGSTI